MAYDRFMIAPFDSGLDKSASKFLLPEDAYQRMNNAYIYRGKILKRFGSRYMGDDVLKSRLRFSLGSTTPGGTFGVAPDPAVTVSGHKKIGSMISIGNYTYTVTSLGTPTNLLRSDGIAATATLDTTSGALIMNTVLPSTTVYFYPAEPVMGLYNLEYGPINDHPSYAFDTKYAYTFSGGAWGLVPNTPTWRSSDSDFFWVANWHGLTNDAVLMFVSNFQAVTGTSNANDDPMYYYDRAAGTWTTFNPLFNATEFVLTAKIIIPFDGRLLLLNVKDKNPAGFGTNTAHPNRVRWSWVGDPTNANAFKNPNVTGYGGGGYKDASTTEEIVGAEIIKDHLIVYFERSTWELVKTGNPADPFDWNRINGEIGTQSTYSTVLFDKLTLSVGSTGIAACNGINVERVDDKIPTDVFDIRTTNNGSKRIHGIRDFLTEMVYWTWPNNSQNTYSDTFPSKILVYNYKDGTWSYNDDTITTWGYFEQDDSDTWENDNQKWEDDNTTWNSGVNQARNKEIIAGNQQGFTFIVDKDVPYNVANMQVTNATYVHPTMTLTIINHTLSIGDYISLNDMNGMVISGTGIHMVSNVIDKNTIELFMPAPPYTVSGTYIGGGTVARVSRIDIVSKQWNPYIKDGSNFRLMKIDFCVDKTDNGEIMVDFSPSSAMTPDGNGISMRLHALATNSLLGTSILETRPFTLAPLESLQERLWHSVYFQTQGNCIQIRMYLDDTEMIIPTISQVGFTLEGLILHTKPTGSRL